MELFGLLSFVLIFFALSWMSSWFLYRHGCTGFVEEESFDFSKVQESIRSMGIRGMKNLSSERVRGFQPGEENNLGKAWSPFKSLKGLQKSWRET